jgi:hypothetical protein
MTFVRYFIPQQATCTQQMVNVVNGLYRFSKQMDIGTLGTVEWKRPLMVSCGGGKGLQ